VSVNVGLARIFHAYIICCMNGFPTFGLVRLPQILAVYPVSESTWKRGVKSGKYPMSVSLSERTVAWLAVDIIELVERKAKEAREKQRLE